MTAPSVGQDGARAAPSSDAIFQVQQARFDIAGKTLVGPIDLAVRRGRVTGLIGHNGSGKSTLLKLLGRQIAPTTGTIRFAGQPIETWSGRAFARQVAFMAQTTPPTDGMMVGDLVALGRYPWLGALRRPGAEDRERIERAMALTDVGSFRDRLVDTLSGGERQRAWLAMMLAQDPDCLLLDEPISALDIPHQMAVMSLIRGLSREQALSIVVVLHDVNVAARFCDDIVALQSGLVVAQGAPADIMDAAVLQRIFGIRFALAPADEIGAKLAYAIS